MVDLGGDGTAVPIRRQYNWAYLQTPCRGTCMRMCIMSMRLPVPVWSSYPGESKTSIVIIVIRVCTEFLSIID